jgi:hypothetical protein
MGEPSDAQLLEAAIMAPDGAAQPEGRRNRDVLHDYKLPAMVRGFIALNQGPATETMAIREAGMMPKLYGTYQGKRVRVVMVSRLGDIGITTIDQEYGYSDRVSIYDLTDFGDEMNPTVPAKRPMLTFYTIVDQKGRWVQENNMDEGHYTPIGISSSPVLHVERHTANTIKSRLDPHGIQGLDVIPVKLNKVDS